MTKTYRVAVIPGDGIGKEVVPEGVRVLEAGGEETRLCARTSTISISPVPTITKSTADDAARLEATDRHA